MKAPARYALSLLLYSLLSVAWSWPLVRDPTGVVVSGFDTWGSIWLAGISDALPLRGVTELGGWPLGQDLGRADSMVFLLLLRLWPGQPDPVGAVSAVVLLGPPITALAGQHCAEGVGARFPWSLVAGLSMGFLGIASATFVDGQTYALLNPWLPLLALYGWKATGPQGTWQQGALAGLFWFLCLLTTAYVGIAATLMVALGLLRRGPVWAKVSSAAVALPLGVAYILAFSGGGDDGGMRNQASPFAGISPTRVLEEGSTQLSTLAGWVPQIEAQPHGVVAPLGMVLLALLAVAPLVLRPRGDWLQWAVLGLLGVALSLGPTLRMDPSLNSGMPWLMAPLARSEVVQLYRFPARMLWLSSVGIGVVASLVLTRLSTAVHPGWLAPLCIAPFGEAILLTGNAWRTAPVPARPPSAYEHAPPGPVLDLFPAVAGPPVDYELTLVDLTCAWAGHHGRPLTTLCLETTPDVDPRARLSASIHDRALRGEDPEQLRKMLSELGIAAVIWRPDAYPPNEREALETSLSGAFGEVAYESWDAGEHLLVYAIPSADADPREAWTRWMP